MEMLNIQKFKLFFILLLRKLLYFSLVEKKSIVLLIYSGNFNNIFDA